MSIFYISAMSAEKDGGIYRYELFADGKIGLLDFSPLANGNYLAWGKGKKTLYSTCTVGKDGGVAAFAVGEKGKLTFLNDCPAHGISTCYVAPEPSGHYLYCANYMTGSLSEFSLAPDGSIEKMTKQICHHGSGPNLKRQESAHVHFTNITPDGKYLVVVDLGIDALLLYPLDAEKGIPETPASVFPVEPKGSGPRHLAFNRAGDRAYLLNELGNTVMFLHYADGRFEKCQSLGTLPTLFEGATKTAAVRLSEDERFLFCSNRGFDSVAVFEVDPATGYLRAHDLVLTGGSSPRDINFLPGYRKFAAANEFSDLVNFFDYDPETGRLTPDGQSLKLPRPLAVYW